METSLEVKSTLPAVVPVAPPMQPITQVQHLVGTQEFQRLPEYLEFQHEWYVPGHKREALTYAEAFVVATQLQLAGQAALHAQQVMHWLTKDLAERTYALARYRLEYRGEITCRQYTFVAGQTFRELVTSEPNRRVEWVFDPIHLAKRIPPHALRAVKTLTDAGIMPEAFWVADKIETVISRPPRSVDPILCAQFGSFLAGIAMWL